MNEFEPEAESFWAASHEASSLKREPSTIFGAAQRGVKRGFHSTTNFILPFELILVALMLGSAILAFLDDGRLAIPVSLPRLLVVCIGLHLLGTFLGLLVTTLSHLISRVLGRSTARQTERPDAPGILDEPLLLPQAIVPSNRFAKKLIACVSLVSAVVLALLVAGWFIQHSVNNHLERAMAEASRDDPHWRIHDLLAHRIPVPDEQNSALIVNEVAESLPENWPHGDQPKAGPKPPPTVFEEAYQRTLDLADNERMPSDVENGVRAELDRLQDVVELARTVANYDRGRHEIVLGPTIFDTRLDETQATRRVARLLVLDAYRLAQEGKLDEALDSCRASLSVGRSIGDEPILISQLVRMANRSGAVSAMVRVMAQGVASDQALAKVQELLAKEMEEPLILWGIRGERASLDEIMRKLAEGELSLDQMGERYDETTIVPPVSFWGKLWYNHQRAVAIEWMNELVAIPQLPTPEWQLALTAFEEYHITIKRGSIDRYVNLIPSLMMPPLNLHVLNHSEERLRGVLVLIAAERHRIKHGDWPESIDVIDPLILPKAPLDFHTDRPLLLDRPEGRYIVHSVGPNLTDEHGAYDQRNWNKSKSRDDVGATGWDVGLRGKPAP